MKKNIKYMMVVDGTKKVLEKATKKELKEHCCTVGEMLEAWKKNAKDVVDTYYNDPRHITMVVVDEYEGLSWYFHNAKAQEVVDEYKENQEVVAEATKIVAERHPDEYVYDFHEEIVEEAMKMKKEAREAKKMEEVEEAKEVEQNKEEAKEVEQNKEEAKEVDEMAEAWAKVVEAFKEVEPAEEEPTKEVDRTNIFIHAIDREAEEAKREAREAYEANPAEEVEEVEQRTEEPKMEKMMEMIAQLTEEVRTLREEIKNLTTNATNATNKGTTNLTEEAEEDATNPTNLEYYATNLVDEMEEVRTEDGDRHWDEIYAIDLAFWAQDWMNNEFRKLCEEYDEKYSKEYAEEEELKEEAEYWATNWMNEGTEIEPTEEVEEEATNTTNPTKEEEPTEEENNMNNIKGEHWGMEFNPNKEYKEPKQKRSPKKYYRFWAGGFDDEANLIPIGTWKELQQDYKNRKEIYAIRVKNEWLKNGKGKNIHSYLITSDKEYVDRMAKNIEATEHIYKVSWGVRPTYKNVAKDLGYDREMTEELHEERLRGFREGYYN